jgi:lysophospholipase L1-like esterase
MNARFLVAAAALVLAPLALAAPASAGQAVTGYPGSIAATGDSITRGYDADSTFPPGERLQYSWATGTSSTVNSFYLRIKAAKPSATGFNDAATGANMVDLAGQVSTAISQHAAEVTVLMGANDVCTSSASTMTPVTDFHSQLLSAISKLSLGLPNARIYVVSIPNVYHLWQTLKGTAAARTVWSAFAICQSMLANPLSTAQADVDRRAAVLQRETDFNTQLQHVCARFIHCRFDNDAVFNYPFLASDANTLDYFHPSITGQAKLASVAWSNGFDFSDVTPPVSSAALTPVTGGDSVALTATDDVKVAGIEYKLGSGHYRRYTAAVKVLTGSTITWRAVDVNGNIEASHSLTV